MRIKTWAVTVMDSWTPMRTFWTRDGALKFRDRFGSYAHVFKWNGDKWVKIL